jgi:hypothetical protein
MEERAITKSEKIDIIVNNIDSMLFFMSSDMARYQKIKLPILRIIERNFVDDDLDKVYKLILFSSNPFQFAKITIIDQLTKDIESKGYVSIQHVSGIITQLINDPQAYESTGFSRDNPMLSNFKNPNDKELIISIQHNQQSQNLRDINIEINPEINQKIQLFRELMYKNIEAYCSININNQYTKYSKVFEENYKDIAEPMLKLMSRNFNSSSLDFMLGDLSWNLNFLQKVEKSNNSTAYDSINSDMLKLNRQIGSCKNQKYIDIHRTLIFIDTFTNNSSVKAPHWRQILIDGCFNKNDKEPITTLANQPQNTTETKQINQQINK